MIQKHKKTILWLSIMVTILIVLIIAFVLIFDIRTINVPDDAVWKGNSKEAFWIQKVSSNDSAIRFRIYNDYDDKMILDADFYSPGYEDNIIYGCSNPMVNGVSEFATMKCDGDCTSCTYQIKKVEKVYK